MGDRAVFADQVEWVPIATLEPHPLNSRQGDIGAIHESVGANGIYRPVYAQRSTRRILAGHHLRATLDQRDNELVPVLWLDVDVAVAERILLQDNRTPDLGTYDDAKLAAHLQAIVEDCGIDGLIGTGYDGDALDDLLANDEPLKLGASPSTIQECPECGHRWSPGQDVES